ncbi:MAG: alpha/beta fold hydrolase [Planctomycetota bacterium]
MPVNVHPASQHGVEETSLQLRAMRAGFRALRALSRGAAARVAARAVARPRRHPVPARERAVLERADRSTVRGRSGDLAVWTWHAAEGTAARGTAILVHGWEARGGQMTAFVDPLVAEGFRVVAFDHPGHGESEGRTSSLPEMRDGLQDVAEAVLDEGVDGPEAIIAHSMGSFATTLLLARGWSETRACYLAPPDDLLVYFARFLELATGDDDLLPDVVRLLEAEHGERVQDFAFRPLVERLGQPLLVLHSDDDRDVPIEAGRYVASHWPGAGIVELEGLGHRRILRDRRVVRLAAEFLGG